MKVFKIGGSCLKDSKNINNVIKIINNENEKLALVLSAVSGITDLIIKSTKNFDKDLMIIDKLIAKVYEKHILLLKNNINNKNLLESTTNKINEKLEELKRILYGVHYIGIIPDFMYPKIISFGERLSIILLEGILKDKGIEAKSFESEDLNLLTDNAIDNATANLKVVKENIQNILVPIINDGVIPIITGYYGITEHGRVATFGRNGTDYSAAVIAYALNADELIIWKDVDGFMTANPSKVKNAQLIPHLSYYEAAELSYFGAKILHPRTIEPLINVNIPVYLKNFYNLESPGTKIWKHSIETDGIIKSVTYNDNISVLKIYGAGVGIKPGIISEIGKILSHNGINIYSVITSQTCINLFLDKNDAIDAYDAIKFLCGGVIEKIEHTEDIALVAVVGDGVLQTHGLAAKVFSAVANEKINVEMISSGASEVSYYFIVKKADLDQTLNAVHNEFFK